MNAIAHSTNAELSFEQFLEWEEAQPSRHEFHAGEVFAMAGGTEQHSFLAIRSAIQLGNRLPSRCRIHGSDMLVRVEATDSGVYPDVSVVCGKPQFHQDNPRALTNPVLIIEVLSPSTRQYDLSGKFDLYRTIPSLREYLAIDSVRVEARLFQRQSDESWVLRVYEGIDAVIPLQLGPMNFELRELYLPEEE
jgi:Uma2 family endonuclease